MDSQENLGNINDTYEDSQMIEDIKSINITNKSEDKKPPNESKTLREISNSNYIKNNNSQHNFINIKIIRDRY